MASGGVELLAVACLDFPGATRQCADLVDEGAEGLLALRRARALDREADGHGLQQHAHTADPVHLRFHAQKPVGHRAQAAEHAVDALDDLFLGFGQSLGQFEEQPATFVFLVFEIKIDNISGCQFV